jgi:hypothetical protein
VIGDWSADRRSIGRSAIDCRSPITDHPIADELAVTW